MPRARGRPKKPESEQLVRQRLLDAAAECLTEKSYRSVSIREIAQKARTNSAMISYYFNGKEGLVAALLRGSMGKVLQELEASDLLEDIPAAERSRVLLRSFLTLNRNNPWLIRLIMDDMVTQDSGLRKIILETIADSSARLIPQFIRLQQQQGLFKQDLNVELATVSLLSLLAFPFLASSILKDAYHIDINEVDTEQWIDHVVSMFDAGALVDDTRSRSGKG